MLRKLFLNSSSDGETVKIYSGYGSPESVVSSGIGSVYLRKDGGAGTSIYVKESGTAGTGWIPYVGETDWTNYFATSTIVGWAAGIAGTIYYKKIGKTVFVDFALSGTSNSTTTTFTLPYNCVAQPFISTWGNAVDNNIQLTSPGQIYMAGSGNIVEVCKTSAYSHTSWTASNVKQVYGQFFYETA
jgi:hypothetical protein